MYDGVLDDITLFNKELSLLEVYDLYNCPPTGSETGLVGYWNFEEGTGITAADLTSNGFDGTLNGGVTWSTDVPVQTCCTSSITNDTTIYFVADSNFSIVSPTVCLDSIDSLFTINGGCDSILNHYTEYLFNAAYYTDTVFITDTTFVTINDTIDVFDTTFVTVTDTVTVNDTTFVTVTDTVTVYDTTFVTITDTVTVYDSIAVTDTLIIDVALGFPPPNDINTIKVYPNPAADMLTIDNGNFALMNNYKIEITDIIGVQVFFSVINQQTFTVDISQWATGLYYIHIKDSGNQIIDTRKIVLQ